MCQQLSIFPAGMKPGEYVERAGERLTWGELVKGMRVIYDCSTEHHRWLVLTVVEDIIQTPDDWRVILNGGRKHRPLINRRYIDTGNVKLYREAEL